MGEKGEENENTQYSNRSRAWEKMDTEIYSAFGGAGSEWVPSFLPSGERG